MVKTIDLDGGKKELNFTDKLLVEYTPEGLVELFNKQVGEANSINFSKNYFDLSNSKIVKSFFEMVNRVQCESLNLSSDAVEDLLLDTTVKIKNLANGLRSNPQLKEVNLTNSLQAYQATQGEKNAWDDLIDAFKTFKDTGITLIIDSHDISRLATNSMAEMIAMLDAREKNTDIKVYEKIKIEVNCIKKEDVRTELRGFANVTIIETRKRYSEDSKPGGGHYMFDSTIASTPHLEKPATPSP